MAKTGIGFASGELLREGRLQTSALPLIPLLQPYLKAFSVAPSAKLPISPLAGEMSGRTEGGGKDHQPRL
ncbi:MAG: hypothetical protein E5Y65_12795 [Mesorhizobium sp.]|nr:MAG: hypothetical protein E5Y70_07635 [Mesorhizobium sp.]TIL90402.1 MAG: hypothetical protein E5Y65_12795 [Mesorhizobium sp.]TIM03127.1 MAG: hypothetical protein E5Y64_00160 [Mesorhizobium sp.]